MNLRRKDGNEPTEERPGETNPLQKSRQTFTCPQHGLLDSLITIVILVVLLWIVVWSVIGHEILPGRNQFGIIVLFLYAAIGGILFKLIRFRKLPLVPPLLGMMLAGFLIRNIPVLSNNVQIQHKWSSSLRYIALSLSLVSTVFGVDSEAPERLKGVGVRLFMGPFLVETCASAVLARFLMGLPWQWGFMLGFVLGAVSPAVAVPSMDHLQKKGYGAVKGVLTLLRTADGFDDVVAITGFSTCLVIAFSTGSTIINVLNGVLQVLFGVAAVFLLGIFIQFFASSDQDYLVQKRSCHVLGSCVLVILIFSSVYFDFYESGELLCSLLLPFIVGIGRIKEKKAVIKIIRVAWNNFEPFLFGLIGAEVSAASLTTETVVLYVTILGFSVLIRIFTTFLMVCFADFNIKEKIFISFAWLPKATVQAALGPMALNTARSYGRTEEEEYGMNVLIVAFLAILITAPVGSLLIGLLGPKLLQKSEEHQNKNEEVQEGSSEQV